MPEIFPTRFPLPLTREVRFTTRLNQLAGATELRAQDQAAPLLRWNLQIGPISDTELAAIQDFHAARGGGYESFVFLDPLDNLLHWSEDFSQAAWQKSSPSQLQITPGVDDPLGGNAARTLANTAAPVNTISQTIAANPQGITFTMSVWLRGSGTAITLRLSDSGSQVFTRIVTTSASWTRFSVSGVFTASAAQVIAAIDIPGNSSVDCFGAQLMPTSGLGAYSRTTAFSGFHPTCCFESDSLAHRAMAPNVNHVHLTIVEHA